MLFRSREVSVLQQRDKAAIESDFGPPVAETNIVPEKSGFRQLQVLQASKFPKTPFHGNYGSSVVALQAGLFPDC